MATAQCFRCNKGFQSVDPDDIAGDGKCPECKEFSKKVALKVDIEMANRRSNPVSRIRQMFTEEEILLGDKASAAKRINIRDLGITPSG